MKKRFGFVSNSSSSSFVLFGKEISASDVINHKHVWLVGNSFGEGRDAFELDDVLKNEIYSRATVNFMFPQATLWSVIYTCSGESGTIITPEIAQMIIDAGGATVESFDKSYGDSYDYGGLNEVIDTYYEH